MFPPNTITINIDGKDYQSEQGVFAHATGVAHDKTMFESVEKDWGSLTGFILDMAEVWLKQMKRTECQVTYNHGNGAIAVGKHGTHPNTPDPYEEDDELHQDLPPGEYSYPVY